MKKLFILLVVLIIVAGCGDSTPNSVYNDNESIRPIRGASNILYPFENFTELNQSQLEDYDLWLKMNNSSIEVAVKLEKNKLVLAEPNFQESYFELDDGKLEIINRGEFGGGLNYISKKENADTVRIWDVPIIFVFNFKEKIYFMVGVAHGMDSGGAIFELRRNGNEFTYEEVMKLDSAPESMAIYRNKILIAGHQMFTVIEDFKKDNIVEKAFWGSLYPNSIVVKSNDEIYIGMRGGYSKLSLNSRIIQYYRYTEPTHNVNSPMTP